jgi:hypothetical protein
MFYIHYDETGNILSVANHTDTALWLETTQEVFDDFSFGRKHFHEYMMVEDIRVKGKMHLVSTTYVETGNTAHTTGPIIRTDRVDSGIQLIQNNESWTVNNFIDDVTCTSLSIGDDHFKEYYIVDATNRFILFDKFTLNLKDFIHTDSIEIQGCSSNMNVSVVTRSSHIPHAHTIGNL